MMQKQLPLLLSSLAVLLITAAVHPCASQRTRRNFGRDCEMKDDYFRTYDSDISQGFKELDALRSLENFIRKSGVSFIIAINLCLVFMTMYL